MSKPTSGLPPFTGDFEDAIFNVVDPAVPNPAERNKRLTGQDIIEAAVTGAQNSSPVATFLQATRPSAPGPWQWWKTDPVTGQLLDLIINNGAP
jgi:hypothetical protein